MYYNKEKALEKLNITESELLTYRAINMLSYSKEKDKYNIDSILEKRTFTIGLDKLITSEIYSELIKYMEAQSSFSRHLFNQLRKDPEYLTLNESDKYFQEHYLKKSYIGLSVYNYVKGLIQSTNTWYQKKIDNLKLSIEYLEEKLKKLELNKTKNKKSITRIKYKLNRKKSILNKTIKKGYIPVFFGKKYINNPEMFYNKRTRLIIQGEQSRKGNRYIRFQFNKSGDLELKIFNHIISNIKIPRSHKDLFLKSLSEFNRQAMTISFNKNGKLVLNCTYSYIKPIPLEKTKGTIGIDIGPKEIACCVVKSDGNPRKYIHFNIGDILDKRTEATELELSKIIDKIISIAKYYQTSITIESLEFNDFKSNNSKLNRLIHKFPREKFKSLLISKCSRNGIKLKFINPAYTSVIGLFKYANRDNLSTNHNSKSKDLSAALVIGRRGLGFNEKAIVSLRLFGGRIFSFPIKYLLPESEKDGSKKTNKKNNSNWSIWARLKKYNFSLPGELTAHLLANPSVLTCSLRRNPMTSVVN